MRWLLAIAAGVAGCCYCLGLAARRERKPREELQRWEGEGGNLPSVATSIPRYAHAGDPRVRHWAALVTTVNRSPGILE